MSKEIGGMPHVFKSSELVVPLRFFFAFSLLFLVAINYFNPIVYGESECAHLFIAPSMYIATEVGEIFHSAVNISNVENLHSCKLTIAYNTSNLDAIQIVLGDFFPQLATEILNNESNGVVRVNISLPEHYPPLNGNGTLVCITFEVTGAPTACGTPLSILQLEQTQLYNQDLELINHNFVSAICFWRSMTPDPPTDGRLVDVYTQKGGKGLDELGGNFACGEIVYLVSNVTYDDWPQQNALVAFQVLDPLNQTFLIIVAETNEAGIATISFRIPRLLESVGNWTAISSVDIACEVVWDTINFRVSWSAVGGKSIAIKSGYLSSWIASTLLMITIVIASSIYLKRKRRARSESK
jgi:hypothetical protein